MAETLAAQPTASIPQASEDWAEAKAIYRFWDNSKVNAAKILEGYQSQVRQRVAQQKIVLSIQDTTDLRNVHHPSKTASQGFGLRAWSGLFVGAEGSQHRAPSANRVSR